MNHVFTYLFQPEKKVSPLLKSALGLLMFFFFLPALAQQAPSNFVTGQEAVTPFSYSIEGYKDGPYVPETTFALNFGKLSESDAGFNRVINSFQVDGRTYVRGEQGNTPFTKVVLKRIDNAAATGNKATAFFEVTGAEGDNPIYITPAYVNDMEGLINSYVFNRGSDNVFSNNNSLTKNNVERIDMIFENGIKAPSNAAMLNRSGVLIMERGGNDSFKFAVIKSLTGGGDTQVAELGALKTADKGTAWGGTGVNIESIVFQRDGDAGNFKPNQYLVDQEVFGTFITLQDMGVGADEMIYGISIFANDVTDGDLVGMSSGYPLDTDGGSSETGGLDFMAGGGFFMLANNVGGRVFHDAAPDPSAINSHTGGQDGSLVNALELYASLTDMAGTVLQTVAVENGGYTFYDVADGEYKVVLHKYAAGASVSDLPDGWFRTGEGANGTKDDTNDGIITLSVPATGGGNLIMNNFGIDKTTILPIEANDDDFGTITSATDYTTPETIFVNDKLGDDPVDPAKVTLKVDGAEVTAAVPLKEEGTGTAVPGVKLNPDGTVTVDAGTVPGTYTLEYTICEKENPDNCDNAVIVIKVKEETQIEANDDDFGTITSTTDYTTPETIFVNDKLGSDPVDPAKVTLKVDGAEVTAAVPLKEEGTGTAVPGVKLNPDGTVTVDAGTAPGTYTLEYTICEKENPDNCDNAVIVIKVKEEIRIEANDDDFGTVTSTTDYTTPETIFVNDKLGSDPVDPAKVTLKVDGAEVTAAVPLKEEGTGTAIPGVKLNPDGTVTVDAGTPPGTYTLPYTICDKENPDNCDDAVIVIRVGAFDLALKKEVKAGQKGVFKEGDEVTFVITVTNEGTIDATDVEVVDYVPEGLELIGTDWVVTDGKAKLATPIASLPAGQEISLEITFKVISDAKPSIRNAAEISSAKGGTDIDSTFDEDRNNDEDDEDDFDTSLITICTKGGNCLPVKTTKIK